MSEVQNMIESHKLINADPGYCAANNLVFVMDDPNQTRVKIADGWAAGTMWIHLEILTGEYTGRRVWVESCYDYFYYAPNCADDGFMFNASHNMIDEDLYDIVPGGDTIQEWADGINFRLSQV